MSTAIIEALSGLDGVIDRLEQSMTRREKMGAPKAKAPQPDLFSVPHAAQPKASGTVVTLDSAVLAKKLDVAIRRVEDLLKEG